MSAASMIMRIIFGSVTLIAVGTIMVLGFMVIEPFSAAFGEPPGGLDWGSPGATTLRFTSFAMIGLLLVLIVWFVSAPIREDQRQQYR